MLSVYRICIRHREPAHDWLGHHVQRMAVALGLPVPDFVRTARLVFLHLPQDMPPSQAQDYLHRLCERLLADPVTETYTLMPLDRVPPLPDGVHVVEVGYLPGVANPEAREIERAAALLGLPGLQADTGIRFEIGGDLDPDALAELVRRVLHNATVERAVFGPLTPAFLSPPPVSDEVERFPLATMSDEDLQRLSEGRLLSLTLEEMQAIRDYARQQGRELTDVELETIAQVWSEHCYHKTFKSPIRYRGPEGEVFINGLLRTYIRAATEQVNKPWVRSAFVDNAGIIAFDEHWDISLKVETHNHPSALEPFGGASTGVGGVVRDILGVSARPIALLDVLCFAPPDTPLSEVPDGVLHPRRVRDGVVAGIADYGNKIGVPTVAGAVVYDPGYLANPLVYCGCLGLAPRDSHPRDPRPGDLIVVLGGRTGRDGLHGATFSSSTLTSDTGEVAAAAVQIGDPITEKGLIEVVVRARDARLYSAITDCGAGGLSSAISEMGAHCGAEVDLERVPLKYTGLRPWEIWLSESQERMVMAVPPDRWPALEALCRAWDVEATVIGRFTDTGRLVVRHKGMVVADLDMDFLHRGVPLPMLEAAWAPPTPTPPPPPTDLRDLWFTLLAHPTVASKEDIIRRYDHEVRGGTVVKPLVGVAQDGPADAVVLRPLETRPGLRGIALAVGIRPLIGLLDPYAMAVSAVDEAVRNLVAVGADPDTVALLDNFCWGNPRLPDRLGALVRAAQGCYDAALAFQAPFISGKDSLYNEYVGPDGESRPIPGTLLITAVAQVPDVRRTVTSDAKEPGNYVYLIGETREEMGGSLAYAVRGARAGTPPGLPEYTADMYRRLHRAIREGLVVAAHDLCEGGLAVAVAEMALAGRVGLHLELDVIPRPAGLDDLEVLLFSESNGRLLVEVPPEKAAAFERLLAGYPFARVGMVTAEPRVSFHWRAEEVMAAGLEDIRQAWQSPISNL